MSKKNLLAVFSQDIKFNYHLIKVNEPKGIFIFLKKEDVENNTDTLEFASCNLATDIVNSLGIKIEKVSPSLFFTELSNEKNLQTRLNKKFSKNAEFSAFVETIKDTYCDLQVRDFLLKKKDPVAYEETKKKEKLIQQEELLKKIEKDMSKREKIRETLLKQYNNDLIKLLRDMFFESIYEEREKVVLNGVFFQVLQNFADRDSWVKKDNETFLGNVDIINIEKNKMKITISDEYVSFSADLRFDQTKLIMEDIKEEKLEPMKEYDVLSTIFGFDTSLVHEWNYKNENEKYDYCIKTTLDLIQKEKEEKNPKGKKYAGLEIDSTIKSTADKLKLNFNESREELTNKDEYLKIINDRLKKLEEKSIPFAYFDKDGKNVIFVLTKQVDDFAEIFSEFDNNIVFANEEIFDIFTFDVDNLKDQPTEKTCDCGDDCSCNKEESTTKECDGDCSCHKEKEKTKGEWNVFDKTDNIKKITIDNVICGECRTENITLNFDIDNRIQINIKNKSVKFVDKNGELKTNKELKKFLKNDVLISDISTKCDCLKNDDVPAIIVFSNKKEKFDYGLFTEEEELYKEYLKNLLIKNI